MGRLNYDLQPRPYGRGMPRPNPRPNPPPIPHPNTPPCRHPDPARTGTACRAPTRATTRAHSQATMIHHRRSIRLPEYDYSQAGAYFITICTHNREPLFGQIIDGEMRLNAIGQIVMDIWFETPVHFHHIELGQFVVMPNHIHGIIIINDVAPVGVRHAEPLQYPVRARHIPPGPVRARHAVPVPLPQIEQFGKPTPGTIPTIIRSFKSAVTKRINEHRRTPGVLVWQRNYWEHIIRNEKSFETIATYIAYNPIQWEQDSLHPGNKP